MLLKGTRTSVLTIYTLDKHYEEEKVCCYVCCAGCWAVHDQFARGDLDLTVMKAPERLYINRPWWDAHQKLVRRWWLRDLWLGEQCTHGLGSGDEDDAGKDPDDVEEPVAA